MRGKYEFGKQTGYRPTALRAKQAIVSARLATVPERKMSGPRLKIAFVTIRCSLVGRDRIDRRCARAQNQPSLTKSWPAEDWHAETN